MNVCIEQLRPGDFVKMTGPAVSPSAAIFVYDESRVVEKTWVPRGLDRGSFFTGLVLSVAAIADMLREPDVSDLIAWNTRLSDVTLPAALVYVTSVFKGNSSIMGPSGTFPPERDPLRRFNGPPLVLLIEYLRMPRIERVTT